MPGPEAVPTESGEAALVHALRQNPVFVAVLERAHEMALPGWYLTAGCVTQTVWNVLTGREPGYGIGDYDLDYFDDSDLSWEAEDQVIRAAAEVFSGLSVIVEVRNEARVHLWYEDRFGYPCPPLRSVEEAISLFPSTTNSVGVRLEADGTWHIHAPHRLSDIFDMIVRPNPRLAKQDVYETKTRRWKQAWPELTVLPWPSLTAP